MVKSVCRGRSQGGAFMREKVLGEVLEEEIVQEEGADDPSRYSNHHNQLEQSNPVLM